MRFALPSRLGLLVALALAGCQSGGQSDLVTRELRMQEDQIYAMEDYLSQYQQLLCEVRAENAALKQQIANLQDDDSLPAPSDQNEPSKLQKRTTTPKPSFRSPGRAPEKPGQLPMPPETEIIEPDVPPLQETTPDLRGQNRSRQRPGSLQSEGVHKIEVRGQSPDSLDDSNPAPAKFIQIRGEVVANEAGGGPRLAVDVEAMSAAFEPTRAVGAVSLMLLEPKKNGPHTSLARWDYTAADVRALLRESSLPGTMQFHLELPADTPIDRPTELWVRIMPENGGKVLGHVRMDLSRPIRFESTKEGTAPQDGWNDRQSDADSKVVTAVHHDVTPAIDLGSEAGWSIARPDRTGQLGVGGEASTGWRAATGPLPELAVSGKPAVQQAAFVEAVTQQPIAGPIVPAAAAPVGRTARLWTPERSGTSADADQTPSEEPRAVAAPARPAWSPVR
jgi:hypothetical protein